MFEQNKFMDDVGFFQGDLRRRASYTPTSSSDGFRFSGDRTTSMTPFSNPFVNQQSRRNLLTLNTRASMADIDLGLCQSLSKMSVSDEERSVLFTGSHPSLGFSRSRNLHGCSRFEQDLTLHESFLEVSSRRQGLMQSSNGEVSIGGDGDYHKLRLLGLEDYPNPKPNPNHRGFTENKDYILEQINQQIPHNSRLDFQETRGNRIFQPFSAMGGSRDHEGSANSMKEDLSLVLASIVGFHGSVYLMAKDQMDCQILQKLVGGSFLYAMIIFREVINHVIELGVDPFGNFLVQELIQVCNEEQRTQIIIMLTSKPGLLVKISLHNYGTRVVQKLIETVSTKAQINLVKSALKPGLLSLVRDVNGNHVIQTCLKSLGPDDNKFVLEGATRFCATIATHRHGCYVLQQCFEYSVGAERENLIAEISRNSLHLAQDPFGNYVVQYIIEQNLGEANVMFELRGNYVKLATQKYSSHVVEKCLVHYPKSRSQIVRELVSVPNFEHLLQDPFANYVIQSALSKTKGYVRRSLVEKVKRFGSLKINQYCKKIFSKSRLLKM